MYANVENMPISSTKSNTLIFVKSSYNKSRIAQQLMPVHTGVGMDVTYHELYFSDSKNGSYPI